LLPMIQESINPPQCAPPAYRALSGGHVIHAAAALHFSLPN
jgi:hypothetical protein